MRRGSLAIFMGFNFIFFLKIIFLLFFRIGSTLLSKKNVDPILKKHLKIIFYELNEFQSLWYDHKTVLEHLNKTVINLIGSNILNIDIYKEEKNKDILTYNSLLVTNAIKFNDIRILDRLKAAYTEWWDVNPKFIESVFTSVNNDKYEELFELVDDMDSSHDDKLNALSALAAISCPDNLLNVMRRYHFLSGSFSFYFFFFLGLNEKNREIILDFICDHFDDIRASIRSDYRFSKIIDHVLSRPSTRPFADKIIDLLNTKKTESLEIAVNKAINQIKWNLEFKEFNSDLN